MLQIIIWLGCFYLVLKGAEIYLSSMPEEKRSDRESYAMAALIVAVLGAGTFLMLANGQAKSLPSVPSFSSGYESSSSSAEAEAAAAGAEAAAEAAIAGAEAAGDAAAAAEGNR